MNSSLGLSAWGRRLSKELMKGRDKKKSRFETNRWNIVRGDLVQVIQGPQTGQKGKITKVLRKDNRVIIDGVNMVSLLSYFLMRIWFIRFIYREVDTLNVSKMVLRAKKL